jgi:hypothetical protein
VDCPVGNPVPPMSLASSDPHGGVDIRVDRLGARIIFWAIDLLHHGGVVMKATVDDGVGVGLGPIIRVVGDIGRRLALMGHNIGREGGARPATM